MTKPNTFTSAMKDFFGLLPDQKLMEFAAELKTLDAAAREEFRKGLVQNGYPIPEPVTA
jgi:hypothetical protein